MCSQNLQLHCESWKVKSCGIERKFKMLSFHVLQHTFLKAMCKAIYYTPPLNFTRVKAKPYSTLVWFCCKVWPNVNGGFCFSKKDIAICGYWKSLLCRHGIRFELFSLQNNINIGFFGYAIKHECVLFFVEHLHNYVELCITSCWFLWNSKGISITITCHSPFSWACVCYSCQHVQLHYPQV